MGDLKPCPFCGSQAETSEVGELVWVRCLNERCVVQPSYAQRSAQEAAASWNARTVAADGASVSNEEEAAAREAVKSRIRKIHRRAWGMSYAELASEIAEATFTELLEHFEVRKRA